MKRVFSILFAFAALTAGAQTHMRVFKAGAGERMRLQEMAFSDGQISVGGVSYAVADVDSIVMVPEVRVDFLGNDVAVTVPDIVKSDIIVEKRGAHLNIFNKNVANEVEFVVSGNTSDGSLNYWGDYKVMFCLDNVSITNPDSAAVNLKCGKRVELKLVGQNSLADGAGGTQKGCLYCKGHLEIGGETGNSLSITANAKHGISTKEYLQLKRSCGSITFAKAEGDAIHCGQYFMMNGGVVTVDKNTKGDGIQVETIVLGDNEETADPSKEDNKTADPSKEDNGKVFIKGGTITLTIDNQDCKGIKCDSLITISGGTVNIIANGNGSRGIQTDGDMIISDIDGQTDIFIAANGGKCIDCTDPLHITDPHKCMGIKADGNLTVNGGTVKVTNTGTKSKGIKVGTYTKNGGTVSANIDIA